MSIEALFGPSILQLNPGLLEAFWEHDRTIFVLLLARSKWFAPGPYRAQMRFHTMTRKYLDATRANLGSGGSKADQLDEPRGGARVIREVEKWLKEGGFDDQSVVGALAVLVFA